jgi:hypothetical protein
VFKFTFHDLAGGLGFFFRGGFFHGHGPKQE